MSVESEKLLVAIERELRALSWWEHSPPSAEALASTSPFCLDTLTLAQWLQFVLLARFRALLAANQPLPKQIAVYPMARHCFAALPEDTRALEEAIARLDEALTGQPVRRES